MPTSFFASLTSFDPVALLQAAILLGAAVLLFLLLFTLRDIMLRTHVFWFQAFCVLLVGAMPIIGFLLYLLIRPARTIKERELYAMFEALTGNGEASMEESEKSEESDDAEDDTEENFPSDSSESSQSSNSSESL